MKTCDAIQPQLIDLHYGLLGERDTRACREHLSACTACTVELEKLSLLTGSLDAEQAFPREQKVDWDRFARVTVRLATADRPGWRVIVSDFVNSLKLPAKPVWVAAAAVIFVGAFMMIARGTMQNPATLGAGQTAQVLMPEDNLDNLTVNLARQNTAKYINETRAVLVTLLDVNIECDKNSVDVSAERAKAMELLRRQRLIAAELHRLPLARAKDVCDDLERLLLEIASLGDCTRESEIKTLRDVVERKQILIRMELLEQELARRGATNA